MEAITHNTERKEADRGGEEAGPPAGKRNRRKLRGGADLRGRAGAQGGRGPFWVKVSPFNETKEGNAIGCAK